MRYFIIFLLILIGCGKKQRHIVEPPPWPRVDVGGYVTDTLTGLPIEGVELNLTIVPRFPDTLEPYMNYTTTDSNGYYLFTNIPMGVGLITAEKEGYCEKSRLFVTFYRDRYDVNIGLLYKKMVYLRGYVLDELTGEPVCGAKALITYDHLYCRGEIPQPREVFTGINGDFYFENLSQGFLMVELTKEGYDTLYKWISILDSIDSLILYMTPLIEFP
jgi:hypothetical protein